MTDPVMRAREPADPESRWDTIGVAIGIVVFTAICLEGIVETLQSLWSGPWP